MIRVLHTESSRNMGGQELRILTEMEGLQAYGIESVLAAREGTPILDEAQRRGLRAFPLRIRSSADPRAIRRLMRIMREERVDVVNAHGSKDGWNAALAALLLRRKFVRSRHVANPIRTGPIARMIYGALADRVLTTSESIKAGMVERGVDPARIVSIPTGVDTGRFHPDVARGRFRAELGIPADAPLVGMVSVLRGDKGPDVFLRAAERVAAHIDDAHFALVGDGWMRGQLEESVAASPYRERIHITGYRRDIPSVMADLDVYVLSARIPEGVPQAILQALAMKVPVVASDVGGINEVAIPGHTALGFPAGDVASLVEAILACLRDRQAAAARAAAGIRLVHERYSLAATLKRMAALYRELVGDRAGSAAS
ncbi:MAG: glycosyltransferase [Gammaproteobacteria bacterium]